MEMCPTASDDSRVDEGAPGLALDEEVRAAAARQLALLTSLPPRTSLEECFRLSEWAGDDPISRLRAGRKLLPVLLGDADDQASAASGVLDRCEPSEHDGDARPRGALAAFIDNLEIEDGVHD
jgi:hypothetical protein